MAGNITVGVLRALLTADTAEFENDMRKGSAAVKKFGDDTKKQSDLLGSVAGTISTAFAGAFTVSAVVNFAREIGSFASKMVDLSAETSISTTRLQAWNYVVGDAGLSIEDFATAVQQLQKRLAGGDQSAVEAVHRLGLNVADLLQLAPDQAFIKIAEAAALVTNHGDQTTLMFDLMGKTGSKALRLISEDLGTTVAKIEHSGAVIDDNLIRKADQFDEAWEHAWMQFRAYSVDAIGELHRAVTLGIDPDFLNPAALAPGLFGAGAGLTPVIGPSKEELKALDDLAAKVKENVKAYEEHQHKLAELAAELSGQKAIKEARDLQAAFESLTPAQQANDVTIAAVNEKYSKLRDTIDRGVVPTLDRLYDTTARVTQQQEREFAQSTETVETAYEALGASIAAQGIQIEHSFFAVEDAGLQMAASNLRMFEEINNAWIDVTTEAQRQAVRHKGAFESLADGVMDSTKKLWEGMSGGKGFSGLMSNLGDSIVNGFGNILSGGLTSVINMGIGLAVEGVKKLAGIIGGLFGSEESKKVNKPRDQFFAQFGGEAETGSQITAAMIAHGETDAGNKADALMRALYDADTAAKFDIAQNAIRDWVGGRSFASGTPGLGAVDFGAGSLAMLHGPEYVVPESRLGEFVSQHGPDQQINVYLDSTLVTQRVVRNMPRVLALHGVG